MTFRQRLAGGEVLAGTFVKTPAHEVVEVLAKAGLDFLCLDAEHAPFDRGRLDLCLAIGLALGIPMLVRVPSAAPEHILAALDSGATGVVVPHVRSRAEAEAAARAARYGRGGRGYAGSTRWAAFGGGTMAANLARSADETVVFAQIEDAEALAELDAIAATPGIDALFLGPADLSVSLGKTDTGSDELARAVAETGRTARAAGRAAATWVSDPAAAAPLRGLGYSAFFVASEHAWMLAGARAAAAAVRAG